MRLQHSPVHRELILLPNVVCTKGSFDIILYQALGAPESGVQCMRCLDCKRERFNLVATRVGGEHVEGKAKDIRGGQEAEDEDEEGEAWCGWHAELGTTTSSWRLASEGGCVGWQHMTKSNGSAVRFEKAGYSSEIGYVV